MTHWPMKNIRQFIANTTGMSIPVSDEKSEIDNWRNQNITDIGNIKKIAAALKSKGFRESTNNLKMKTFSQIIKDTGKTLLEQPEDELPPEEAPPEEMSPEEGPPMPVEPEEEMVPDDIDKLQVDMLELVRKALIINPNDIDRQAYAKLTTQVSFDNKDDLKVLLRKLVENHYPDLELGGIEPGTGV